MHPVAAACNIQTLRQACGGRVGAARVGTRRRSCRARRRSCRAHALRAIQPTTRVHPLLTVLRTCRLVDLSARAQRSARPVAGLGRLGRSLAPSADAQRVRARPRPLVPVLSHVLHEPARQPLRMATPPPAIGAGGGGGLAAAAATTTAAAAAAAAAAAVAVACAARYARTPLPTSPSRPGDERRRWRAGDGAGGAQAAQRGRRSGPSAPGRRARRADPYGPRGRPVRAAWMEPWTSRGRLRHVYYRISY